MALYAVTSRVAAELATLVDEAFAAVWTEGDATLATSSARRSRAELVSLGRDAVEALRNLPRVRCVAACITCLGSAVRLDIPSAEHLLVRATVAVTCCGSVTILRHRDGRVDRSLRSDGSLVEALNGWADLIRCPACAETGAAHDHQPGKVRVARVIGPKD